MCQEIEGEKKRETRTERGMPPMGFHAHFGTYHRLTLLCRMTQFDEDGDIGAWTRKEADQGRERASLPFRGQE